MKALVIAAGEGKRLREMGYKGAKPLYNLLGLSLLERNLFLLRQAGIQDVVIVLGYRADDVKEALGDGHKLGMNLRYVLNEKWELGNGVSVLAAKEYLKYEDSFILVMADHVLAPEIMEKVVQLSPEYDELYVGADFKLDKVFDLEEATKLELVDKRVVSIGKNITRFQAVDCGVFHATPFIFEVLERSIKDGKYSWSDAVRILAEEGRVWAIDIGECCWLDVDNLDDARKAEKMLLERLPSPKDGLIARYLNRRVSLFITRFLSKTTVKPNQVSVVSFLLCLVSALLFVRGYNIWAGIAAQIASIIDGVDGELARLKFLQSKWGEMLDSFLDRYGDGFIITGMAINAYYGGGEQFTVGLWFSLALMGAPLSMLFKEKFKNVYGKQYLPEREALWANLLLGNRDGRLFIVMLAGILGRPLLGLIVLAITSHLLLLIRIVMLRNMEA